MKTSYPMTVRAAIALTALAAVAGSALAKDDDRHEPRSEPTVAVPTNGNVVPGTKDNFDPTYNVCRGTDPRCYHPWVPDRQNKVLLYTRTAGPRHANLGPALPPGKNPALLPAHVVQNTIVKWMAEHGVTVDWTEDVNQINNLNQYKAVIFASTSRDTLFKHGTAVNPTRAVDTTTGAHLDSAKTAMRQYMRAGGGFVAIHNAFGTEYNWPWYEGLLGNANYYDHGQFQNGDIEIVSRDSSTEGLPRRFGFKDEWYNLVPFPTNVKFLATVDENSLATKRTVHPGHGDFHPVAWCQYYDGGRAWLTTLGHDRDAFTDGSGFPGQNEFKQFLVNGILSAMGNKPFCTE
jgi:type 1 glutamine amidotransferase